MNIFLKKVELIYIRGLIKEMAIEFKVNFGKKKAEFYSRASRATRKSVREDKYFAKIADKLVPADEVIW
ncbi:hypothetical protein HCR16_04095 [Wolbachia pipientis]|uniref:hypothetical protein n=1 Tax=Wolbachia pipientis TaxID=955 RepID=UPI0015F802D1|nr:hypothetical protein [Wolbachia pipientis]MBA8770283.1 hypothetical protein [Wolbachia pipientis]